MEAGAVASGQTCKKQTCKARVDFVADWIAIASIFEQLCRPFCISRRWPAIGFGYVLINAHGVTPTIQAKGLRR